MKTKCNLSSPSIWLLLLFAVQLPFLAFAAGGDKKLEVFPGGLGGEAAALDALFEVCKSVSVEIINATVAG